MMIAYSCALSSAWAASNAHVLQNDSTGKITWTDRDSRESEVGTPTQLTSILIILLNKQNLIDFGEYAIRFVLCGKLYTHCIGCCLTPAVQQQ